MVRLADSARAAALFGDWPEAVLWACLDGTMGAVWADDPASPRSAMARLGDFRFFAGLPRRELLRLEPAPSALLIPRHEGWSRLIRETFGPEARPITRYAVKKEPDVFSRPKLENIFRSLPPELGLREIDEALYGQCLQESWSRDLASQFPDYGAYRRLALGVAAVADGEPVSGASAYARYRGGIEIEVDTRPDCRRRGLARACAAALILRCLDRGLYPSWDAHTPASLALAESLGYHRDRPYPAFVLAQP